MCSRTDNLYYAWQTAELHSRYLKFRAVRDYVLHRSGPFGAKYSNMTAKTDRRGRIHVEENCDTGSKSIVLNIVHPGNKCDVRCDVGLDGKVVEPLPSYHTCRQNEINGDSGRFDNQDMCAVDGVHDGVNHVAVLDSLPQGSEISLDIFRRSTLLPGGALDEAVCNVFKAVNLSSSSSVLFTRYNVMSLKVGFAFTKTRNASDVAIFILIFLYT